MMAEMKPCPFCGGKPCIQKCFGRNRKSYSVQCSCGILTRYQDRQYKATELWNRRCESQQEIDFDYGAED